MFGIGFLNTIFLTALGAILLPVIIHILNRRRIRRVPFSSLRFLEEISQRRMRTINLRRAIILLLRTLAVLFLVLAFARPVIQGAAALFLPGTAPAYTVICLDASYSMGVERERGNAFTRAKELAAEVIDRSGDEDLLNLLLFSSSCETVFGQGTRNRELVQRAISAAPLSERGTDLNRALLQAVELVRASGLSQGEIYVISDFRALADTLAVPAGLERIRLLFLPVYREAVDNVSIDRVLAPRKLIRPGEVMKVGVAVTNHSREQETRFPLELIVDGKRKAEKEVVLSPASSAIISFPLSLSSWGRHRCLARKPADRLALDDQRRFHLEISKSVPVTLIAGSTAPGGAGSGSAFYLSKALDPRGYGEGEFTLTRADERTVTASELPRTGVVVWAGPGTGERNRLDIIRRYVHAGGSLALFLTGDAGAALAERGFLKFIGATTALPAQNRTGSALTRFKHDHPVFEAFTREELELFSRSLVREYVAAEGVAADSVLASLANGDPVIWECTRGRGTVLVFASAPTLDSGNLPLSPMFLPVMHTAVSYLADAVRADMGGEGVVGDELIFDLPPELRLNAGTLEVQAEGEFYGQPHLMESPAGGQRAALAAPESAGFYTLVSDTQVVAERALNPDPAEGDLTPVSGELLGSGGARVVDTGERFSKNLLEARQGKEVFALFLLLALAALVAESLLGRRA